MAGPKTGFGKRSWLSSLTREGFSRKFYEDEVGHIKTLADKVNI